MERIMMEDSFMSSRIILIEPHDSKLYWRKVSEILTVVDRDLGLSDMKISDYRNKKVNVNINISPVFHLWFRYLTFNNLYISILHTSFLYSFILLILGVFIYTRKKCLRCISSRTYKNSISHDS